MAEVTVRDLRNKGREVLDRVQGGERLTVTRDGRPVAEPVPLPARPLTAAELVRRWKDLPPVDPVKFRADVDTVVDPSLWGNLGDPGK